MSTRDDVFKYVMNSPENTNPAVLKPLLNGIKDDGVIILEGEGVPSNSLGKDGQIYLRRLFTGNISGVVPRDYIENSAAGNYFEIPGPFDLNSKIEMKVKISPTQNFSIFYPFGYVAGSSAMYETWTLKIPNSFDYVKYNMGGSEKTTEMSFPSNQDIIIKADFAKVQIISNNSTITAYSDMCKTSANPSWQSMYLFGCEEVNSLMSNSAIKMRFYYCKVYNNEKLVAYYAPGLDSFNRRGCLVDIVNKTVINPEKTTTELKFSYYGSFTQPYVVFDVYVKVNGSWQSIYDTSINNIDLK